MKISGYDRVKFDRKPPAFGAGGGVWTGFGAGGAAAGFTGSGAGAGGAAPSSSA
jgi:hypothetical protein